ncbi:hypothetical protein KUTeg_020285 [Tegillarca granosa]|uniref:Uncharacterized protein n=1 Tax=Tegillarca granosa TaxID=220873 RepID=A0ABQ9E7F1_TEGGR|nr:hypothetical protein KUTeg_020285 [Tegillarca granosa]
MVQKHRVLEHPGAKAITFCGSPYYMSPEMFQCKPYDSKESKMFQNKICYSKVTKLLYAM